MSWTKQNVAGPVPTGLANLVQGFGTVINALVPLLATASAAVDAAKIFFNTTTNPYSSIVTALLAEAQAFNNDLFGTGVYYLSVTGNNVSSGLPRHDRTGLPLLTPRQCIESAIESFNDKCDTNRPQFSPFAEVTAVGILATAPTADQFINLIQGLLSVLSLPDWASFLNIFQRIHTTTACQATPPNWTSYRLNSIQDLKNIQDTINGVISALQGYSVTADNILNQLQTVISGKQAQLTQLQNQIFQIMNNLRHTSGIYIMNLPPTVGGNAAIQNALLDCPLEQSLNQFTIATIIVGGGPSLTPVNLFRQMIL